MTQPANPATVRACPICGSNQISVIQADIEQAAAGITCILKCECGATVTLSVQNSSKPDPAKKA